MNLKKIMFLFAALFLVTACGNSNNIVPYTSELSAAEKHFQNKDGFLVIANTKDPLINEITDTMKDDKYQDLSLKVMDIAESNYNSNDKNGVINIVKNGKIIAHFGFNEKNTGNSLANHALRIYNSENRYKLDDNTLQAFKDVIDLTELKKESVEESKKFFNDNISEPKKDKCKFSNDAGEIILHDVTNSDCNVYSIGDENLYKDTFSIKNNKSYAPNEFESNLLTGEPIKLSNYEMNSYITDNRETNFYRIANKFDVKDKEGKVIFSDKDAYFNFFNNDDKRYAYISAFAVNASEHFKYHYVIDKLDNKIYKTKDFFLENDNNIYAHDDKGLFVYDSENKKTYPILDYKKDDKLPLLDLFALYSKNDGLTLLNGLKFDKTQRIDLQINKMQKLDIIWGPNLLDKNLLEYPELPDNLISELSFNDKKSCLTADMNNDGEKENVCFYVKSGYDEDDLYFLVIEDKDGTPLYADLSEENLYSGCPNIDNILEFDKNSNRMIQLYTNQKCNYMGQKSILAYNQNTKKYESYTEIGKGIGDNVKLDLKDNFKYTIKNTLSNQEINGEIIPEIRDMLIEDNFYDKNGKVNSNEDISLCSSWIKKGENRYSYYNEDGKLKSGNKYMIRGCNGANTALPITTNFVITHDIKNNFAPIDITEIKED